MDEFQQSFVVCRSLLEKRKIPQPKSVPSARKVEGSSNPLSQTSDGLPVEAFPLIFLL